MTRIHARGRWTATPLRRAAVDAVHAQTIGAEPERKHHAVQKFA